MRRKSAVDRLAGLILGTCVADLAHKGESAPMEVTVVPDLAACGILPSLVTKRFARPVMILPSPSCSVTS